MADLRDHHMFWITRSIAQGGFPYDDEFGQLRAAGITHLFNVDLPYLDLPHLHALGFKECIWHSVIDGRRIPDATAKACLDDLHRILHDHTHRVYVHCHAGMNRSPTIVFLYLIALGLGEKEAADRLTSQNVHAIPGHPALCDANLLQSVRAYGQAHYLPLTRSEVLEAP